MDTFFKRILLALDLTEMDDKILSFAEYIIRGKEVNKMYVIHIVPHLFNTNFDISSGFYQKFGVGQSLSEKVLKSCESKLNNYFKDRNLNLEIIVLEGQPYQQLLDWQENNPMELIVLGNKNKSKGSGITARRFAHKSKSNLLFVSDAAVNKIEDILVPVDFSEHSTKAINSALSIKRKAANEVNIHLLYIEDLLSLARFYGLNLDEIVLEEVVRETKNTLDEFLESTGFDKDLFSREVIANTDTSVSKQLCRFVQDKEVQLVVMGAQGHSGYDRFVFGSVAEKFVDQCKEASVLVVR